jgi:hypothetical protein
MRRHLMLSALFACSALLVGCQADNTGETACTMPCTMPGCEATDCQETHTVAEQHLSTITLPPETVGSILDRSTWAKTDTYIPAGVVQHFPVLLRDTESPSEKRARRPEDPNETSDERLDRVLAHSDAGNWSRENVLDAALQPLKFLYDVGVILINLPIDLSHGVPQTPDPVSDNIRQEKCILYP